MTQQETLVDESMQPRPGQPMPDLQRPSPHWRTIQLGDVALQFISGGTPSTQRPELWDGAVPWTTSAPIDEQATTLDHAQRFITSGALAASATNVVPHGNLLVGTRVGVGKAVVNLVDIAISQDLTGVVLDTSRVFPEFIAFQFKMGGVQDYFDGRKRGTTIKGVSRFDLQELPLQLPPLPEQRAIAYVLRTVQDAIAARRRELELERERKAALMQRLFTHGTRGEPTKMTEIGEMPESWRVVQLGDVATISSGGTPDRTRPEYWNGDIPWVKTGEIDYNVIAQTEEHITQAGLQNSSARLVPSGTLLMAMYGQGVTRGRVAILGLDATLNQACAAIRVSSSVVTNFLFHYLAYGYERIRNLGHGANQKNLNALLIRSIVIPIPDSDEQQAIADTLTACDGKANALNREITLLEELFRALLEELMTSRLSALPLIESAGTTVAPDSEVSA